MPTTEAYHSSSATTQPSLAEFALVVAILRKQKALSQHGKKFTPRVWRQFNLLVAMEDVVLQAARKAERLTSKKTGQDFHEMILLLIVSELLRLLRHRGRPPKKKPLIGPFLQKKQTTRMTTAEEQMLSRFVYGYQCGLYAEKYNLKDYRDYYNFINRYGRLAEIDEIPLAEAIRHAMKHAPPPYDKLFKGRTFAALKTHFSRNKRTRRVLPKPK